MIRPLLAALVAGMVGTPLAAQSFVQDISLSGLGTSSGESSGIAYEPTLDLIFVAVSGTVFAANDVVAIIDPNTDTVVGTIATGARPRNIAFHYGSFGAFESGLVTNLDDGTVTVFDLDLGPKTTISLPDPLGLGSCFPEGIVVAGDLAFVTTRDGSGDVHAIDLTTMSYSAGHSLSSDDQYFGRPALSNGTLIAPSLKIHPLTGAISGGAQRLRAGAGGIVDWFMFELNSGATAFPAGTEALRLTDGRTIVGGADFEDRLNVLDVNGELLRTLLVPGGLGSSGLSVDDAEALLASCDGEANKVAFVDLTDEQLDAEFDITPHGIAPEDSVFVGGKLYVTCRGSEAVVVIGSLPVPVPTVVHGGSLSCSDTTPETGTSATLALIGNPGLGIALLWSTEIGGGGSWQGVSLDLSASFSVAVTSQNAWSNTINVPDNPNLRGRRFFMQGVVDDGFGGVTTWPLTLILQ